MKLIQEKELEELVAGYATVEPKSEPFERLIETIKTLWPVVRAAEEHSVSCMKGEDDVLGKAVDAFHGHK